MINLNHDEAPSRGEVWVLQNFLLHLVATKPLQGIFDQQISDEILQVFMVFVLLREYYRILLDQFFCYFRLHHSVERIFHILGLVKHAAKDPERRRDRSSMPVQLLWRDVSEVIFSQALDLSLPFE